VWEPDAIQHLHIDQGAARIGHIVVQKPQRGQSGLLVGVRGRLVVEDAVIGLK